MVINNSYVRIENSFLIDNNYGLDLNNSSLELINTKITDNTTSGIIINNSTKNTLSFIENCIIQNNNVNGINISNSTISITYSLIADNGFLGISNSFSKLTLINNTIANNKYYGLTNAISKAVIINNIFTGHVSAAIKNDTSTISNTIEINNNSFWANGSLCENCPGLDGKLTTTRTNGDSTDSKNNHFSNPGYKELINYGLKENSICLNAGIREFTSEQLLKTITITSLDSINIGYDSATHIPLGIKLAPASKIKNYILDLNSPVTPLELFNYLKHNKRAVITGVNGFQINGATTLKLLKPGIYLLIKKGEFRKKIFRFLLLP